MKEEILSETKNNTRFSVLAIGDSGTGKTTAALTATAYGTLIVLDFDGKLKELKDKIPAETQKKIKVVSDFKTPSEVKKYLLVLKAEFEAGKSPCATICIDTWSRLSEMLLRRMQASAGVPEGQDPSISDLVPLEQQKRLQFTVWNLFTDVQESFISLLKSLPCNVIINAHVEKTQMEDGTIMLAVSGSGSFRKAMPQMFQNTLFFSAQAGEYKIRARKSSNAIANNGLADKWLTKEGLLIKPNYSVFEETAYRQPEVK